MEEAKGKEEIQIGTELECTVVTAISHSHKQFAPHLPIQSILERLYVSRKKDKGAQICSKDWRPEETSGGPYAWGEAASVRGPTSAE